MAEATPQTGCFLPSRGKKTPFCVFRLFPQGATGPDDGFDTPRGPKLGLRRKSLARNPPLQSKVLRPAAADQPVTHSRRPSPRPATSPATRS